MNINLRSSFIKSITILASGSIVAQMINFIFAPVLTRLFSPDEMGLYTYILSILFLFMPIINARFDMSIVTEKHESNVYALIKFSLLLCLFFSTLVSLCFAFYINTFSQSYLIPKYVTLLMFLLLLSGGVINILNSYNNRKKEYKLMSSVYVIRTTSQNVGATLGGLLNLGMPGLLVPYLLGQILGVKKQAGLLLKKRDEIISVSFLEMKKVMKLHYKQPLYSTPAIFANNFSYSSLTFFIGALFGMGVVGLYSISVRVLGLPLSIISGNVSRVFFENASHEYNQTGQFYQSFKKSTIFLVAIAIPMILVMFFLVPPITTVIFGEIWAEAGVYIKLLSVMFGLRFIVSSLTPGLLVAKKQNYELFLQLLFIVSSVSVFFIVKIMSLTIFDFLNLINILFSIIYVIYFITIYRCSKNK